MATYCVCGSEFTDNEDLKWIACDNPNGCPVEWFHIGCVGLTDETVPENEWFCQQCQQTMVSDQTGAGEGDLERSELGRRDPVTQARVVQTSTPPRSREQRPDTQVFVCEICEEQFTEKRECLQHKAKHFSHHSKSVQSGEEDKPLLEPEVPSKRQSRASSYGSKSDISQRSASSMHSGRSEALKSPRDRSTSPLSEEKLQLLRQFSDEEIIAELSKREEAFVCVCGILFEDKSLYYLHKGCHNTNNPKKCSFCSYEAKDYYDFTSHFFQHSNTNDSAPSAATS